jgi:hypothetical protein
MFRRRVFANTRRARYLQQQSDSLVPTTHNVYPSSPVPMDVDSRSPLVQKPLNSSSSSPNAFLGEAFNDPSPIPAAKKRLIHDDMSSPLAAARPSWVRPPLEKAATTTSLFPSNASRRRPLFRRASNLAAQEESTTKPTATVSQGGSLRDSSSRRVFKARRAQSACEPPSLFGSADVGAEDSEDVDDVSSPSVKPPPRRPAHSRLNSAVDESSGSSGGRRVMSMDQSALQMSRSPSEFHFGGEAEGKILPCFSVKEDGLMRISPTTVCRSLELVYLTGTLLMRELGPACRPVGGTV